MAVASAANAARFVVTVGLGGVSALLRGSSLATRSIGTLVSAFSSLATVVATLSVGIGVLSGVFTAFILTNARMIDRIGKLQKVIGVSTDVIQKFAFAGEQTGISFDQSTIALRRFARRLGEAEKGTGELLPALRRLGISTKTLEGDTKSVEQVLFEFADGLKNTESETGRLALAFKGFDSEGAELVATLEEGGDKLKEFFDQAERLGFVLSRETIRQVEAFNDSFNVLVNIVKGAIRQFVGSLAPALQMINKDLEALVDANTDGERSFKKFGETLKNFFFDTIIDVLNAINKFIPTIAKFANFFIKLANQSGIFEDKDVERIKELTLAVKDMGAVGITDPTTGISIPNYGTLVTQVSSLAEALQDFGIEFEGMQDLIDMGMGTKFATALGFGVDDLKKARDGLVKLAEPIIAIYDASGGGKPIELFPEETSSNLQQIIDYLMRLRLTTGEIIDDEKEITDEIEKQLTFAEKLAKLMETVDQRLKDFNATAVDLGEIFNKVKERLGTPIERLSKTLEDGLVKGVELFEDTLANAIVQGKADFSALGDHIKQVLAKALVQKFISGPILAAFGLASGGPAKAGQPYIVGEEGPELFVPKNSGTVIPNDTTMDIMNAGGPGIGGGGTTIINNISAVDTQSFKQALAKQDPEFIFGMSQAGARRVPG